MLCTAVTNGLNCGYLNCLWHPKVKWILATSLESLVSVVFGTSGITFQNCSGKFLFAKQGTFNMENKH